MNEIPIGTNKSSPVRLAICGICPKVRPNASKKKFCSRRKTQIKIFPEIPNQSSLVFQAVRLDNLRAMKKLKMISASKKTVKRRESWITMPSDTIKSQIF